jgi:anti-sigma-K factor RskA
MSCDEVKELLASFAIGALEEDERLEVDAHLKECRLHDRAIASLRTVVDALPLTVDERDPPPGLRERILGAASPVEREPAAPVPITRAPSRRRPTFNPGWALAAAAVVIAGLVVWNVALQTGDGGGGEQKVSTQTIDQGSARMVYLPDEDLAVVELELAPPPPGSVYQMWEMRGAVAESLGVVPGTGSGAYSGVSDADALALSIEPPGGSEQPTTMPVLVMELD